MPMNDSVRTRQVPYQRVAVIGLGAIGMAHVQAALNAPSADLVAVVDIDPARVEEVAATHDCRGFTSIESMVDLMDVDIAIVCTPDQLHVDAVRVVAQAGINILLEKPIATTVEDAREILRIVEEAGVAFTVGHCLRFDPKYVEIQRAIEGGSVGDLATVYARRQNQVGVVE